MDDKLHVLSFMPFVQVSFFFAVSLLDARKMLLSAPPKISDEK